MQEKQIDRYIFVERAIDELRRQQGILLRSSDGAFACIPVESLDAKKFTALQGKKLQLILTGARAKEKLPAIQIDVSRLSLEQIQCLADPLARQCTLPKLTSQPASKLEQLSLTLAKNASLLPALLLFDAKNAAMDWPSVSEEDIEYYISMPVEVVETANAKLPLEGAENNRLISFRTPGRAAVHLALIIGDVSKEKSVLARVHSSCVTGDILGSMRCDCGDQLHLSIEELKANGSGVLIYLHQEGRGIGITNKLRAYALQEQGIDTYAANLMLGFDEDERDFSIAAAILKKLGISRIRMLSNNPHKITSLEKQGIVVAERVPLVTKTGKHNHAYLDAKGKKAGHLF